MAKDGLSPPICYQHLPVSRIPREIHVDQTLALSHRAPHCALQAQAQRAQVRFDFLSAALKNEITAWATRVMIHPILATPIPILSHHPTAWAPGLELAMCVIVSTSRQIR